MRSSGEAGFLPSLNKPETGRLQLLGRAQKTEFKRLTEHNNPFFVPSDRDVFSSSPRSLKLRKRNGSLRKRYL